MTSIRPLDWTYSPSGNHVLGVGAYLALVTPYPDDNWWWVLHGDSEIASGHAYTPERAKADAETAITKHQLGAAA